MLLKEFTGEEWKEVKDDLRKRAILESFVFVNKKLFKKLLKCLHNIKGE